MAEPVRLRLSRAKGFSLQAMSLATNGLPASVVTRATIWGNPFSTHRAKCLSTSGKRFLCTTVATVDEAVDRYRQSLTEGGRRWARLGELHGRNLACFCRLDAPCHADVLLDLARRNIDAEG